MFNLRHCLLFTSAVVTEVIEICVSELVQSFGLVTAVLFFCVFTFYQQKYFECRISKHVEDSASSPEFCEPHERILQLRPQDLNLFPRSPVLDPSIFPHCVDLSDDSFSASTSSPFSTFGKSAATSLNFKPSFTSPLTRESKKNSDTNVKEVPTFF